jgi:hypothetical protein
MVTSSGMVLIAGGLLIGAGTALALTRLIAAMLYNVSPADPLTRRGCTDLGGFRWARFAATGVTRHTDRPRRRAAERVVCRTVCYR